jgi:BirA family transcriptional regulator, biotin operon repressor / biotin---[acetyl-CoA-carboxylase] ligase
VTPDALLRALADGDTHSAEELGRAFAVTPAAVRANVAKLANWGVEVPATHAGDYRLARPLDLIDARAVRAALAPQTVERIAGLDVFMELDSTNEYLLSLPAPRSGELAVCIAEFQHAGRGRRGRRWNAPLGSGLCLSAAWQFPDTPTELAALTLAVGVVARRAVAAVARVDAALKWPNDLAFDEKKLGGVLLELGTVGGRRGCHVVAGIGINVALPPEALTGLSDWPRGAVDLATAMGSAPPARAVLAASLIDGLAGLFAGYATAGFAPYRTDWCTADLLRDRRVTLEDTAGHLSGTARGIEADGALVIETANGTRRRVICGDISVRSA